MLRKLLLFLITIFLVNCSYATTQKYLDSVNNVYTHSQSIKEQITCLYILSFEYGLIHPRRGIEYGKKCLELSSKINDDANKLNAYNGIGNAYESLGNFDSARYFHHKSYQLALKGDSKITLAVTLFNIGNCYKEVGNYHKALEMYIKGYRIVESLPEYNPRIHYYLGELYIKIGNITQAMYHSKLGIFKCRQLKQDYIIYNLYVNYAKCLAIKGDTSSAFRLLNNAMIGLRKNTDLLSLCICLNGIGELNTKSKKYNKALTVFLEESLLQSKIKNCNGICIADLNVALCYAKLKNKTLAQKFLLSAINNINYLYRNKDVLMQAFYKIGETYEEIGIPDNALRYYKKFTVLKDSLVGIENLFRLNQLQTKYDFDKKEKLIKLQHTELGLQNNLIEQKKLQIIALALIIALILVFGLFFYNRHKTRQKINFLQEIQKQEKLREIALKQKENDERLRIAKNIHDELGSGISKIFLMAECSLPLTVANSELSNNIQTLSKSAKLLAENMKDLVWSLDPENNTLDNLVARMHEFCSELLDELPIVADFNFQESFPEITISKNFQQNVFLTFKEGLNNSIKHSKSNVLSVSVVLINNKLEVKIIDNGIGFSNDKIKKTSNGLRNMKQRITEIGGKFEIITNQSGTSVIISCIVY